MGIGELLEADSREERSETERYLRTAYDTLFGLIEGAMTGDIYGKARMLRHLDRLYEGALNSLDLQAKVEALRSLDRSAAPAESGGPSPTRDSA